MRAYDARDAFLLGQKMMLNREREGQSRRNSKKELKNEITLLQNQWKKKILI